MASQYDKEKLDDNEYLNYLIDNFELKEEDFKFSPNLDKKLIKPDKYKLKIVKPTLDSISESDIKPD